MPFGLHVDRRSLLTDEYLRVKGSDGSIWAFGDAATIDQPRALQRADELFELADVNKVCAPRAMQTMQHCWPPINRTSMYRAVCTH
jgi:NADH dehydrogenase FAD-containing subunit